VPLPIHDERLSQRVGGVVLLVTAAVIVYVIGFRDRFPQQGIDVRVSFAQSTGMREGAAVRVAGRDIGIITSISLQSKGGVVVTARIRHEWAKQIPVTSVFFVGSKSILAPRYLEIAAPDDPAPARPLADGDELQGVSPPDLDRVLQRVWNNLEDVDGFMQSINPATAALKLRIAQLRFTIGSVVPDVDLSVWPGAIAEGDRLAGMVEPDALAHTIDGARGFVDRAKAQVGGMQAQIDTLRRAVERLGDEIPPDLKAKIEGAIARIDPILRSADLLLAQLDGVIADATTGSGAIAAFGRDLELIDDVKAMTKMMKRKPWRVVIPDR
jgi:hypothetical protein